MIESLSHEDFVRMLVTLWAVWTARRKAIHENIFQSPLSTFGFVTSFMVELGMTNSSAIQGVPRCPAQPQPVWIPPPPGMVKINVDAAVARDGAYGAIGVVCRDATGSFLGASSQWVEGVADPATLEAMAGAEALCLAADI